jgi:hypothetical protein
MRYIYLIDQKEALPVNLAGRGSPQPQGPFSSAIKNSLFWKFFSIVFDFIFFMFLKQNDSHKKSQKKIQTRCKRIVMNLAAKMGRYATVA